MSVPEPSPRRSSFAHIVVGAVWALSIPLTAMTVNQISTWTHPGERHWGYWVAGHRGHLFVWRICVYVVAVAGWHWMRTRVLRRETGSDTSMRLRRAEVAAVIAALLLETTAFLQGT